MTDRNTVTLSDSPRGLRAAVSLLRAGELVAFPTETVYGLGADARNDRAVAGIFAAKGRPAFNPLIVHVTDIAMAEALASFTPAARRLGAAFWPGPLTLVLPRRPDAGLSHLATAGLDTVALRVPAHPLADRLLRAFGGPLAAPSANLSGRVSPTRRAHVLDGLDGRIAAVFEGGACPVGLESTILGFDGATVALLRPGGLAVETIEAVLGTALDLRALRHVSAPGQLASHYAPRASMRLDARGPGPDEVWLGFGPVIGLRPGLNLSPEGDLVEAAANLFAHLREADALALRQGVGRIAVAPIPMTGLGLAINDRLRRAAAPRGGPMNAYLTVFLGAGIGGALRHGVNLAAARLLGSGFPSGTLIVNILGSFAMGVLVAWFARVSDPGQSVRLFLTTGVLGGFTTFSAFSLDAAALFERGAPLTAAAYVLVSVAASLAALGFGLLLVRHLV